MYWKLLLIIIIALSAASAVNAEKKNITPYGDYSKDSESYGACKDALSPDKAIKSLNKYYKKRGYKVRSVQHKGRFIEADIYKNDKQVDKVIFDRKSGRLRSIY